MANTSIFEVPIPQLLEQQTEIRPVPDKGIGFSESMTDKEIEEYILSHSKKRSH